LHLNGFVDIHSHLLPGIDDGPSDLEASVAMARAAVSAGTEVLAATPHLRSDFPGVVLDEIAGRCRALSDTIDAAGIPLRIVSGSEASLLWAVDATDAQLATASYGGQGRDILVETPDDTAMIEQLLYRIRSRGLRVTLAHPERSRAFHGDPTTLERLHDQGVVLAVNADALLSRPGGPLRRLAEHLCREGLAEVVTSDGHRGERWRPVTALAEGVGALTEIVGEERAEWMSSTAPAAIIAGVDLPDGPEVEPLRRPFWRLRRG
jgi:protein-tyrosine phosphatase